MYIIKGASATVNTMYVNGSWALRTFNYGAGCPGPDYGSNANGVFLEALISQSGGSAGIIYGYPNTNSLAQVTVCVPPPAFSLNWVFGPFGGTNGTGYNPFTQRQAAITMMGIPNPPKHK